MLIRTPRAPSGRLSHNSLRTLGLFGLLPFVCHGCTDHPTGGPFENEQGIDAEVLENVYAELRALPGSFSLLVQRNGVLVGEEYFNGFTPDSIHDVRSVTKSVISILIGMAIEEGFIPSVDEPMGTYLTPVVDSIREEVANTSIRHFLMMSSGLDWHELDLGTSYSDWWESEDMIQHVVDLPIVHSPGAQFIYNTGASHLLSVVLTEATGMPTLEFAREYLFDPLGFSDSSWLQENRGYDTGGMGLRITARDMMKIGQMFLDGGRHEGTQLVPQPWIAQSVSPLITTDFAVPYGRDYGYLWWVCTGGGEDFFLANGYGGQFILVVPALDLVIVTQNSWRGLGWTLAGEQWYRVLSLLVEEILPAVD